MISIGTAVFRTIHERVFPRKGPYIYKRVTKTYNSFGLEDLILYKAHFRIAICFDIVKFLVQHNTFRRAEFVFYVLFSR